MMATRPGLDVLLDAAPRRLGGLRAGWIVNPTSVDGIGVPSLRRLLDLGLTPAALFGPEHGLWGAAQDMIAVEGEREPLTGLPVRSLYGEDEASLAPRPEDLAGLDLVVYDVQDIGARYYTYVYTLMLAMKACARAGVRVLVLDRPNPIGGVRVEGGTVDPALQSFVGMHPLATRHGMTTGELARLFAHELGLDLDLEVVWMQGYQRDLRFSETGLPWVMPSPNMPTVDTALVYPGQCLLEGTTWSEGRGTTRPFELFGAPGVDPFAFAAALNARLGPTCWARPLLFRPTFQKHAGQPCGGAQLHVRDPDRLHALRVGLCVLAAARQAAPDTLAWRQQAYEFVADRLAIDLLLGDPRARPALEAGAEPDDVLALLEPDRLAFLERRRPFLHYPVRGAPS